MGQKVNPIGFRLILNKRWRSHWFATGKTFGEQLVSDQAIRKYILKKTGYSAIVSAVKIKRMLGKVEVTIVTSRPGRVIGPKGAEIDNLKVELSRFTGQQVFVEVEELKRPDADAKIVAESIAKQLERRMPFRRVMKKAIQSALDAGAVGIKVQVSGRLGGAEIARTERYQEGSVPLHTLRANIDYATARGETTYGTLGVKVWINKGEEHLSKKEAI